MIEDKPYDERLPSWQISAPIAPDRAQELQVRLNIPADPMKSVFPFNDVTLTRADVEWLLIHHERGRGPVDWSDPTQRGRQGLDLRGARLCGEDLSNLPLARLIGGLSTDERLLVSKDARENEIRDAAGVHMEGANLTDTHLEGAILRSAHLEGACLFRTRFERANLTLLHMEGSDCRAAHFEGTIMASVHLEGFTYDTPPCPLHWVADASGPVIEVRQIDFPNSLPPASLRLAYFDAATSFYPTSIGDKRSGFIAIVDARLSDMNLARVDWTKVSMLGDERIARSKHTRFGKARTLSGRIANYKRAVRANSQLAIALSAQGMADQATRFLYRSLILQRNMMALQIRKGQVTYLVPYLLSWFLFLVTGYGYRMWRLLLTYMLLITGFAAGYGLAGNICAIALSASSGVKLSCRPDLPWFNLVLISLTAFHGRVFSQQFGVGSPQFVLTAAEAIVGLVVESIFIAMLTQRVFNR